MESEEVAYAAKQRVGIAIRCEVLAIEVLESRVDVLERNVACTDFPALRVDLERIERRHQCDVLAEVTVSGISAPRALVGRIRALVGQLDVVSRVVVVGFRVLREGTEEIPVVVELVASADGPDVGIVRLGRTVVVRSNILNAASLK